MKCDATSNTTHDVLISKELIFKSYKEVCSEPKIVNLGFRNGEKLWVVNNKLTQNPKVGANLYGENDFTHNWEVFYKFFSIHNIEPNWLDCKKVFGHDDKDTGGWTGCMGKV